MCIRDSAPAVLPHGLRHDGAASRPEGRAHGIVGIVVVNGPRHQSRQYVGRGEKQRPVGRTESLRGLRRINARKIEPRTGGLRHAEPPDELQHHFGCLLVVLLLRHEGRHEGRHRCKAGVELPAPAADIGGIEAHRRPLAGFGQRLEKTSFDFGHGTHRPLSLIHISFPPCGNGAAGSGPSCPRPPRSAPVRCG